MPASVTVLVVEDDPVILRLLEVNFELEGFNVLAAHDGAEGIELARAEHPDVIIRDIMMPTVSGLELEQAVKGEPDLAPPPLILLSAKAQSAALHLGLDQLGSEQCGARVGREVCIVAG